MTGALRAWLDREFFRLAVAPGFILLRAVAARSDINPWMQAKFESHCGPVGERGAVTGVVQLAKLRLDEPGVRPPDTLPGPQRGCPPDRENDEGPLAPAR